jgi:maleylpyruvate isomerase
MRVDRPHVTCVGDDIAHLVAVHRRLEAAVHGLDDGDMRSSSRLPGWSMGHLLTHLARNADSVRRRAEGAMRGAIVDQYPGGYEGRAAEIAAGAGRPSAALLDDVATSNARLELVLARVPADAWAHLTRDVGGTERPLYELPCRRWYEVEVHLVDFGDPVGLTHEHWPDEFVARRLPEMRAHAQQQPVPGSLSSREELAWLYGRLQRADLPAVEPWDG